MSQERPLRHWLVIRRSETGFAGEGFNDIVLCIAVDEECAVARVQQKLREAGNLVPEAYARRRFEAWPADVDYWSYYSS